MSLKQFKEKYGCDIGAVQKEAANQQLADVVNMQPPPPPSTPRRSKRALNTSNPGGSSMKVRALPPHQFDFVWRHLHARSPSCMPNLAWLQNRPVACGSVTSQPNGPLSPTAAILRHRLLSSATPVHGSLASQARTC